MVPQRKSHFRPSAETQCLGCGDTEQGSSPFSFASTPVSSLASESNAFSHPFVSPATAESNSFSLSTCQAGNYAGGELADLVSAATTAASGAAAVDSLASVLDTAELDPIFRFDASSSFHRPRPLDLSPRPRLSPSTSTSPSHPYAATSTSRRDLVLLPCLLPLVRGSRVVALPRVVTSPSPSRPFDLSLLDLDLDLALALALVPTSPSSRRKPPSLASILPLFPAPGDILLATTVVVRWRRMAERKSGSSFGSFLLRRDLERRRRSAVEVELRKTTRIEDECERTCSNRASVVRR